MQSCALGGARELPEHDALATSSQQKSHLIEKTCDTEKSEEDELFDVSRTWAFEGIKGSPVATEEITRLSKTVFSQSMRNGVTFPVRYFCPELKDIRENRVRNSFDKCVDCKFAGIKINVHKSTTGFYLRCQKHDLCKTFLLERR